MIVPVQPSDIGYILESNAFWNWLVDQKAEYVFEYTLKGFLGAKTTQVVSTHGAFCLIIEASRNYSTWIPIGLVEATEVAKKIGWFGKGTSRLDTGTFEAATRKALQKLRDRTQIVTQISGSQFAITKLGAQIAFQLVPNI